MLPFYFSVRLPFYLSVLPCDYLHKRTEMGDGVLQTAIELGIEQLVKLEEGAVADMAEAIFNVMARSLLLSKPVAPPDEPPDTEPVAPPVPQLRHPQPPETLINLVHPSTLINLASPNFLVHASTFIN